MCFLSEKLVHLKQDRFLLVSRLWSRTSLLKEIYFYVSVDGKESMIRVTWSGIVQGSILGPILYAIFISSLFDIENLT